MADALGAEASLSYCMSLKVEIRGVLDRSAAMEAIRALYRRHDALRTTFSDDGMELRIRRPGDADLTSFDFSALEPAAREAALRERLQLAVERGFDLRNGPVFRAELIALAPEYHVAIFRTHHIVCDGWSLGLLMSDFAALYAQVRDGSPPLPPAPSFADFAAAYTANAAEARADNERYWAKVFDPLPPPLDLPPVRSRPPLRSFASARMDSVLERTVIDRVAARAGERGYKLFSVLFAAFALVMSRISGNEDLVIGVPTAGQLRTGHRELVGYCIDFVPVRCRVDPGASFESLVAATRGQFRTAMRHRVHTFAQLISVLKLRPDPSRVPLVNVMLTSLPLPPVRTAGPAPLELRGEHIARRFENFEILADVFLSEDETRVECQYSTSLFDDASVRGWFAAFETALEAVGADFSAACGALPLVSKSDRSFIESHNATQAPAEPVALIHERIEAVARSFPDRPAVSFGATRLTYAELDSRANRFAHFVRAHGAARGAMVGLLVERGADMVVAQLGILKAGAAYVPLDPAYPAERLAYMLGQCNVSLLVADAETRALAAALGMPAARVFDMDAEAAAIAAQPATALARDMLTAGARDPAYVVYTSGSTGKPKGVVAPHGAVVNFLASMTREPGLSAADRVLATTTLSFDPAVLEIFGPLGVGAEVIVATRDQSHDAYALRGLIESSRATWMQATPSLWRMLIETGWSGAPELKGLTGSEALRPELARDLLERVGELWNMYGPTETTVWATCWKVERPERGIFVGRPIANTTAWIFDARGQPCPVGVPGEIYIGGAGMALGYIEQPDLTAERFVTHPLRAGETLYRTGDRGRWRREGVLELLGRLDFQLKVRGHRIEPGEIEANLATHPRVGAVVVTAHEERAGDARIVAYVVCREPAPAHDELRSHVRQTLPEYMVPQHFVFLHTMPRLPNGKIDRDALPAPEEAAAGHAGNFVEPRSAVELAIARVWRELLGTERISVTDNFFDLGGHSLLAMSAVVALERELGVRPAARELVYDSLAQIAAGIERRMPASRAPAADRRNWLARLMRRLKPRVQ